MAMDQQTVMERLKELYREKNEHLEKFLEPVTPFEFYRAFFLKIAMALRGARCSIACLPAKNLAQLG